MSTSRMWMRPARLRGDGDDGLLSLEPHLAARGVAGL
jgi:hypothetical protein